MKRHYGTTARWGDFVIIKRNIVGLLEAELRKRRPAGAWMASVTDAWQPVEEKLRLTRACMERLLEAGWRLSLLTKSALILRDLDLISRHAGRIEAGLTVTTNMEHVAASMEPGAPPIAERIRTLAALSEAGADTHAFVGPALPMDAPGLARTLRSATKKVLIDRMNYRSRIEGLYRSRGWLKYLSDEYFDGVVSAFRAEFGDGGVTVCW
jgi:DNA repair photolyase